MPTVKSVVKSLVPKILWEAMRRQRVRRIGKVFVARTVTHHYAGKPLQVRITDPMGEDWYDKDWNSLEEIEWLQKGKPRSSALVFNIGAHQAVVASILSRIVGPDGKIVAVEANQHNVDTANKNVELNLISNITVLHAAGADKPGTLFFRSDWDAQTFDADNDKAKVAVRAVTIDELAEEYGTPDVLYIDVEGFECHVLQGAEKTLQARPDAFVEVHVNYGLQNFGGSVAQVAAFFPENEYALYMIPFPDKEETSSVRPFTLNAPETLDRFFLIALSKNSIEA